VVTKRALYCLTCGLVNITAGNWLEPCKCCKGQTFTSTPQLKLTWNDRRFLRGIGVKLDDWKDRA
jgi:hypothetical protein